MGIGKWQHGDANAVFDTAIAAAFANTRMMADKFTNITRSCLMKPNIHRRRIPPPILPHAMHSMFDKDGDLTRQNQASDDSSTLLYDCLMK